MGWRSLLALGASVFIFSGMGDGIVGAQTDEPVTAGDFFDRGGEYFEQGQYNLAITDFTRAIRLDPDYAEAYFARGRAIFEVDNQYLLAASDFGRVITLIPTTRKPTSGEDGLTTGKLTCWRPVPKESRYTSNWR